MSEESSSRARSPLQIAQCRKAGNRNYLCQSKLDRLEGLFAPGTKQMFPGSRETVY